MADVFISYASQDRARAQALANALKEYGWSVWWDRSILAGDVFDEVIERELGSAKSVVVLWSSASVSSEWVRNEAAEASKRGVLVPVVIDSTTNPPLEFRRKQTVNLLEWDGHPAHEPFLTLRDALAARISGAQQPLKTRQLVTVSRMIRWNWRLIASVTLVIALAIAAGAYWATVWERAKSISMPDVGSVVKAQSGRKLTLVRAIHWGDRSALFLAKASSGDEVVVKIFRQGLKPGSADSEGFTQEQRAAEVLKHDNIVRILDFGEVAGYPFTVTEYFPAGSLQDWLQSHDRVTGEEINSVARQLARAIDFAHSKGILHRDVKPSNILMMSNPQGRIALGDFGIARALGAVEMKITAARNFVTGSPAYLAPEAIKDGEFSTASDIYSFGVVLFEMIARRTPFDDRTDMFTLLYAKANVDAPDIRTIRRDVSPRLAARLGQTLSRDRNQRPGSAKAVLSGVEDDIARL